MRVAFNARLLRDPSLRGWNRYTVNLLAHLPALGVELLLYSDRPLHERHLSRLPPESYQVRVAPPMRYLRWEQTWLPRQCALDRADVLHCPLNFGLPWFSPCRRVLTLHDAIDQVYYAPRCSWCERVRPASLLNRFYNWQARARAEAIISVSQHARGDLIRHLGLPAHKITVIPEAADPRFHDPIEALDRRRVREAHGLGKSYVLYLGGCEQRKNVPFLVRAFAAAGLEGVELVLAGGDAEQREPLAALAAALGVGDCVRLLNWVEDEDLPALYAEALCFVYPSAYEGFGLQLCEAMAVRCPVLAARATALPETLGGGGETFDLNDSAELSQLLRRCATDQGYRARLSRSAAERSTDFCWRRTAEQTLAVYGAAMRVNAGNQCPERAVPSGTC
jgi:glycosyltransferase involved in cell wall biosynthesis